MSWMSPPRFTPTNLRRIEFVEWSHREDAWVPIGQAWVDENGRVQGDTEDVNRILDGGIKGPNMLVESRRMTTREDGPVMLFGLLMETANATYWGIRVIEVADD